jgi:hypothetical protein
MSAPPHWSGLFKDIPFGGSRLDIGGSLRYRYEHQENFNIKRYADPLRPDDDLVLQRFRLDFDFHLNDRADAYVELQDARAFGSDFTIEDFVLGCPYWNYFDLRQAYVEWHRLVDTALGFKIGRQSISYADNRIWGPGEWGNVGRYSWDAVKVYWETRRAKIDFIFGDRIRYLPTDFDSEHFNFHAYGIYASMKELPCTLDLFWIRKASREGYVVNAQGQTADVDVNTVGLYFDGHPHERWRCRGTLAHQFGSHNGAGVSAYGANVRLARIWSQSRKVTTAFEYSYASGDSSPGEGSFQTFDGVFGAIDMMYGRMNLVSWQNLHDYQFQIAFVPRNKTRIVLDWHLFYLDKAEDAWYYCSGRPQRRDPTGASGTQLSQEIDLVARYKHSPQLDLQAGYAHFFPGAFIRNTGPSPDADWFFFQFQYKL